MKLSLVALIIFAAFSAEAKNWGESSTGVFDFTLVLPLSTSGSVIYTAASVSNSTLKQLIAAKEDAAFFLATEGAQRTAKLDSALQAVHAENPELVASDLDLAQFILSL
jgi:conserverd hypothetical protein